MGVETTSNSLSGSIAAKDVAFRSENRIPRVCTTELEIGLIKVIIYVPNLQPGANNGRVHFTWIRECGFDIKVYLKVDDVDQLWRRTIKKLPSDIILHSSSWECLSGKIEITLRTNASYSWVPMLHARGLDQSNDDEEDD